VPVTPIMFFGFLKYFIFAISANKNLGFLVLINNILLFLKPWNFKLEIIIVAPFLIASFIKLLPL